MKNRDGNVSKNIYILIGPIHIIL